MWSSTSLIPTYVHVLLCPPGLQSADPHPLILSDKCFFPFPNSPETWLFLWLLFSLRLSQVETTFDSHSLCISEREDETQRFPLCFSLPFSNRFSTFLKGGVGVGWDSLASLRLRLPDSIFCPLLYCCYLCHSSSRLGNQLLAVDLYLHIDSCCDDW